MLCPLRLDIDPLPDSSPWIIDEAVIKKHCHVDDGDDIQDENLQDYVASAILWAENATHRTIIARDHRWVLREFPYDRRYEIRLPRGKTNSVGKIEYSAGGVIQTLYGPSSDQSPTGNDFQEELRGDEGGVLMPPRGGCWPSVDCDVPAPVTITFNAGWAVDDIPRDLFTAILMATSDAFDLRGSGDTVKIDQSGMSLSSRDKLISGYILSRWY